MDLAAARERADRVIGAPVGNVPRIRSRLVIPPGSALLLPDEIEKIEARIRELENEIRQFGGRGRFSTSASRRVAR